LYTFFLNFQFLNLSIQKLPALYKHGQRVSPPLVSGQIKLRLHGIAKRARVGTASFFSELYIFDKIILKSLLHALVKNINTIQI